MKTAYVDGACRISNPGLCSCAWVYYEDGVEKTYEAKYLGPVFHTNNYAEYQALITLLRWLYTFSVRNVVIHSDSELVVNQTLGKWDINQADLRGYAATCYGLLMQGCHVLKHIKGHDGTKGNERADELCNEVLDQNMEAYYAYKNILNSLTT